MLNFSELDELLDKTNNRKPYTDGVPAPTSYNFRNYMDDVTTNPNGWSGDGNQASNYELNALKHQDLARYAAPEYEEPQGIQSMQLTTRTDNEPIITVKTPALRRTYTDAELSNLTGLHF